MPDDLTIEDLEKHSGLPTRTLRYYMQIGLLPGPETRGKNASYVQEHLDRLDLILILKEMYLPLKEIRDVLNRLTPAEIVRYRDDQEDLLNQIKGVKPDGGSKEKYPNATSALDYIKSLEEAHSTHKEIAEDRLHSYLDRSTAPDRGVDISRNEKEVTQPEQEIWRRIILEDGIELNIRDTRDKEARYKIDRLLSFARSIFKK